MGKKIKGKAFIKTGAYWFPDAEADISGIKKLFRFNANRIPITGPVKNGEVILDNAYYDVENQKLIIEIDCSQSY